jgi:hypothetical protein
VGFSWSFLVGHTVDAAGVVNIGGFAKPTFGDEFVFDESLLD